MTSVHAFASDPLRGVFILVLLGVATGGALLLFAIRAPSLQGGGLFAPISREGGLLLNNLLLTTAAATVLIGTLYPLFLDVVAQQKVSVGPPFFNMTFVPIMVPLLIAMAVGPLLSWKRGDLVGGAAAAEARLRDRRRRRGADDDRRWGRRRSARPAGWRSRRGCFAAAIVEWAERIRLFSEPLGEQRPPRAAPAARRLGHDLRPCRDGGRRRRDHRLLGLDRREDRDVRPGGSVELAGYTVALDAVDRRARARTTSRPAPICGC